MNSTLKKLQEIGLVPVVKIDDASKALPLAQALIDGGLPCAEITFRTNAAAESIRLMRKQFPEMIVGAGTVLTRTQVDAAIEAGATFIVSPGLNPDTLDYALGKGALMMPGISDASGVEAALARGIDTVKFFPAEPAGGLPYIKALAGPYANVKFMPTGGINLSNLGSYLSCPSILACGGTWMVAENLIAEERWDEITAICQDAVKIIKDVRA
ncbi:MAG: bifunctional 4-hydroxy-2-oxoglutarate aldolase/2-dehydro-3-deoxy-phosphogluconate aldolase [Atopobiaceae bacterium]|nr:bifunctional 4-hydroxy-2-oxoglutarate aldolase/2-dehydro-3-deoxy-phosphogluconate aldolase [Atopobiaceae bacterium]